MSCGSGNAKGRIPKEAKKPSSLTDAEALRKCLEDNNGDNIKCKSKVDAFKSVASSPPTLKPFPNSRLLTRGSLTDV
ncbi:hypothetical protein SOVF_057930 [Spinacia oleracea]|nr:hypothetical protein SOVF_057930 [Spinacia oleracea]